MSLRLALLFGLMKYDVVEWVRKKSVKSYFFLFHYSAAAGPDKKGKHMSAEQILVIIRFVWFGSTGFMVIPDSRCSSAISCEIKKANLQNITFFCFSDDDEIDNFAQWANVNKSRVRFGALSPKLLFPFFCWGVDWRHFPALWVVPALNLKLKLMWSLACHDPNINSTSRARILHNSKRELSFSFSFCFVRFKFSSSAPRSERDYEAGTNYQRVTSHS